MNDKQQLAAMGAQYRLTEEQAKLLAERMPQSGVLQILDVEPLCMAKRIEELEAQVRAMAELLRDLHKHIGTSIPQTVSEHYRGCDLLDRIDAALAGKLPERSLDMVSLSDIADLQRYTIATIGGVGGKDYGAEMEEDDEGEYVLLSEALMLAAAPSPDSAK